MQTFVLAGWVEIRLESSRLMNGRRVFPTTLDIARQSAELDFRADLVDEIIASTSIIEKAPLLTRDRARF
jgi:predicted nucleic acid-binding protein